MAIQITSRVTEQEKKILEDYCKKNDIKVAQLIRWAVREYLAKKDVDIFSR